MPLMISVEIVIGGNDNTKSVIRDGGEGEIVVEAVTLNILDGDEFRPFWVSWDDGKVVVRIFLTVVHISWKQNVKKEIQHLLECIYSTVLFISCHFKQRCG